jgi:hypothetical protein
LRMRCASSMPAIVTAAFGKDLKPAIEAHRRLIRGLSSNWTENRGKERRSVFLSVRISSLATLNDLQTVLT